MTSLSDALVHDLQRVRSYSTTIGEPERKVLTDAIAAISTSDHALTAALPTITTVDSLLTILSDPKRYQRQLTDLAALVKEAKAERAEAQHAVADLEAKANAIGPVLQSARAKADEEIVAAQSAFDLRVIDYQRSLSVREAAVADAEQKVKADSEAAEKLKAEMQRRLDAIRFAAA
jgi:cell division protein FtsL